MTEVPMRAPPTINTCNGSSAVRDESGIALLSWVRGTFSADASLNGYVSLAGDEMREVLVDSSKSVRLAAMVWFWADSSAQGAVGVSITWAIGSGFSGVTYRWISDST
jgi:hypothetical protein